MSDRPWRTASKGTPAVVRYYLPENGETLEDAEDLREDELWYDLNDVAEAAAEHFFHHRDGWEVSWPVDVTLVLFDGSEHTFTVDNESVPTFHARKKKANVV